MNKRILNFSVAFVFGIFFLSPGVFAQERGSFEEAKSLVNKGLEHVKKVGIDVAFKDFTEDKEHWVVKDIYLFALDMKGNQKAHGFNAKQIGKNMWDFKDANGKLMFQEFTAAAQKGKGTVEYEWTHPTTKKIESKQSYIVRIPNTEYYIGAGAYK
ncbi:MAG: cache domain-containing protein [Undibacterium sp.]|nr:cache domain-containing protein [Undibacterium sp.]